MINCAVCGSRNIIFFNRFADYPLTNLYLDVPSKDEKYKANLEVYQCHCGHIQANSFFDSKNIYTTDYPYNGSASGVVARRDKGVSLIKKNVTCNRLNTIVDIGCGQLEMINLVRKQFSANRIIGLDPVPLRMNLDDLGDIEFYNEYFTGANFRLSVGDGPNLFMLDNVLEHVPDPNSFLSNLNDCTALGDFIYVCVPSCESMLMKLQFQELIHEHVHYFSIPILNELLGRHGFKSVESCCDATGSRGYNYILYVKSHDSRNEGSPSSPCGTFENAFNNYSAMLDLSLRHIDTLPSDIWGVCASELTPTLSYHMKSDLSFCRAILDTSSNKLNKYMPGIQPRIIDMGSIREIPHENWFFITAPSVGRQVVSNLTNQGVSNIILPIAIF